MTQIHPNPGRPPYLSVALISAAALAYEILLMRLFSIIQWHHFSYMIIGLALLGYGFSGTLLAVFQRRMMRSFNGFYLGSLVMFGLSSVLCFMLAQSLPFNAEMVLWDYRQFLYLLVIFLLLSIPFLFAASAICLAFMYFPDRVSTIYARDLIGAGLGGLVVLGVLFLVFPDSALILIGILGIVAFLVGSYELGVWRQGGTGIALLVSCIALLVSATQLQLAISPYKSLSQTLRVEGTSEIDRYSSPFGLISVVESKSIPFRHAPGLSMTSTTEPPGQLGLFADGDNMTVMNEGVADLSRLAYLDQMTSAAAYIAGEPRKVLIVGAGGGADVLQALRHDPVLIDAIELNPQMVDIVGRHYAEFNGGLFDDARVDVHAGDVRGFLSTSDQRYDLIQISLMDAFNASSSGLYALNENYLYTVEALKTYLDHLAPGGILSMTRWVKVPPQDTLKLFATAVDALNDDDITVHDRLVLLRSWQTSTLLVGKEAFSAATIESLRAFGKKNAFDVEYAAGYQLDEDVFNHLPEPWFRNAASALASEDGDKFRAQYKFDIDPASDDRPYFHHTTKWSTLQEVFELRARGGMPLIEWGYVVLLLTVLVAIVLSVTLIIAPLAFLKTSLRHAGSQVSKLKVLLYFLSIGVAFLFMEIAMMQKFIQLLHHPLYSFALTITTFLVFAGIGSNLSEKLSLNRNRQFVLAISVAGIVLLSVIYMLLLEDVFLQLASASVATRMAVAVVLLAPLATLMGMPFPLALAALSESGRELVPWAWGINGCASVISASLATLIAIEAGFSFVILVAVLIYALIPAVYPLPRVSTA